LKQAKAEGKFISVNIGSPKAVPVFPIILFLLFGLGFAQAQTASNQIVPFRKVGSKVEFTQPQGSISFSLQSQVRKGDPWTVLSTTTASSSNPVVSLTIPARGLNQNLRVVASVRPPVGLRRSLPFTLAANARSLTFHATNQVRLYSVERQATNRTWTRVSTVAASTQAGRAVRVNLPASLGRIPASSLRVMAVSGDAAAAADFSSPVAPQLRSGFNKFPARPYSASTSLAPVMGDAALLSRDASAPGETVEEADLWQIRGRKIYLFNQHRGLQVLDTAVATNPVVAGYWPLPAVGEDMYLLGPTNQPATGALLLARLPWRSDRPDGTRILRLAFSNDVPSLQTFLDLPGGLQESRLVGNRLHLVSTSWQDTQGNWSPTTWVITLNVSQPGVLVEESRQSIPGYVSCVGSTARYLWLAGAEAGNWSTHTLRAFPIQTGGTLGRPLVARLGGVIQDKFKVGDVAGGLAAVVQTWTAPDGSWRNRTLVETYGTGSNGVMNRRAQLEIIRDEWLFATRFDGDRLYAVTFQQVDPLWLIDLRNPAAPAITGHLEVPGWSSFIEPLGNLLVAVGREDGRVQVSLFDVSNRADPKLASRVNVGDSGYSWSEAEWNEKAVKILPAAGLVLVPVTEWVGRNASHGVRIVGLNQSAKTLTAQGTIRHSFSPRRATLLDGSLVASVSNRELLLVDAANRQAPAVKAEVTLAFGVDRLALRSGYLYQFENANSWEGEGTQALLRVAAVNDPDDVVAQIPLSGAAVLAAEIVGDRLVVVEGAEENLWGIWGVGPVAAGTSPAGPAVSVWSLQNPALPSLVGRAALAGAAGSQVVILPGPAGLAAITRKTGGWSGWGRPLFSPVAGSVGVADSFFPGYSSESLTIDLVRLQASPAVVGTWSLQDSQADAITSVQAFGDLLVFGYQKREAVVPVKVRPGVSVSPGPALPWRPIAMQARSWLQVVDLADPALPAGWAPVEIPGALLGFSWLERGGGVLFSRSGAGDNRVYALGFDGESASVAAEVDVGAQRDLLSRGSSIYATIDDTTRRWDFSEATGFFGSPFSWKVPGSGFITQLEVLGGTPWAFANSTLYRLQANGQVTDFGELPGWPDLKKIRSDGASSALPTGPYGSKKIN